MCAKHFLEGSILEKKIMEKLPFFQAAMTGFGVLPHGQLCPDLGL